MSYVIIDKDGAERAVADVSSAQGDMRVMLANELGQRQSSGESGHIRVMKDLEICDHEPMSDVGHLKYYPNGALMMDLLRDYADRIAFSMGVFKVDSPSMYRMSDPRVASLLSKFNEKVYKVDVGGQEFVLRPSASDLGSFEMLSKSVISHRNLPFAVYDNSFCYRLEKSGECSGLRRLRQFWMPDIHSFCRDEPQAIDQFVLLCRKYDELMRGLGIDYVVVFRVVESYYGKVRGVLQSLASGLSKEILVELLPQHKHYWVMKGEWQAIGSGGDNAQLSTVQLDLENSERFGIKYVDADGQQKGVVIVHSSMSGLERMLFGVLEHALREREKGRSPVLPLWLAGEQVRVIPVSKVYLEKVMRIAQYLEGCGLRVGLDDSSESVGKKVALARKEWLPFFVVVGGEDDEQLKWFDRRRSQFDIASPEAFAVSAKKQLDGKPHRPAYAPMLLSKRIIWR